MGCCGEKRARLRASRASARPAPAPAPPEAKQQRQEPPPRSASEVVVEYSGAAPIAVRSSTGLLTFSAGRRTRAVPARDVARLLRNPLFRLADG